LRLLDACWLTTGNCMMGIAAGTWGRPASADRRLIIRKASLAGVNPQQI
jgi:hypothetical protein